MADEVGLASIINLQSSLIIRSRSVSVYTPTPIKVIRKCRRLSKMPTIPPNADEVFVVTPISLPKAFRIMIQAASQPWYFTSLAVQFAKDLN
jgi:hypothetical protein